MNPTPAKRPLRTRIIGTGSALPKKILTNSELERMVDTSDEWIRSRTGIRERRIASDGETATLLGLQAAREALEAAGIPKNRVDMLIVATTTPDMTFPSTACLVQAELKLDNCPSYDVMAACSGFVYGLSIADQFIRNGQCKTVLIVGTEIYSRITDWTDRNTCVLFGDGAASAVVQGSRSDRGILSTHLFSNGSYADLLFANGCYGSKDRIDGSNNGFSNSFIQMKGNQTFKVAVQRMSEAAMAALLHNKIKPKDVGLLIPHQANRRIIDAVSQKLGLSPEQVFTNLDRTGNTSAASIPLALDEAVRSGRIRKNDLVLFVAFGGGFTWGSALIRW
jgi:3-oxoacyl-[acyl-carrier-protein] synthase-3